jgi:hypothetical protein
LKKLSDTTKLKKKEVVEEEEKASSASTASAASSEEQDVDSAVKSILGARLTGKQVKEAADTTPEAETKENKELESKLSELIK